MGTWIEGCVGRWNGPLWGVTGWHVGCPTLQDAVVSEIRLVLPASIPTVRLSSILPVRLSHVGTMQGTLFTELLSDVQLPREAPAFIAPVPRPQFSRTTI